MLTEKDFEEEARIWCATEDIDPDSREMYPDPRGYAVCRYRPAWVGRAIILHNQWMCSSLVSRAIRRLGL